MGTQRQSAGTRHSAGQPDAVGHKPKSRFRLPWIAWLIVAFAAVALVAAAIAIVSADLHVIQVHPDAGSEQATVTTPIRVTFSREPDEESLESHYHIEPEVAGTWAVEGDEAVFIPDRALDPGASYTVTLEAGLRDKGDRQLADDYHWQFRTREPQLLYLGWPEPGASGRQLFLAPPNGAPKQLTGHPLGVWDYAVHPQGEAIAYSTLREDGGADLWRMDRDGETQQILLDCPEAACLNPAWSPDGRQLAYERRDIWAGAPNLDPGASRIWLLDLEAEEERPLFDYDVALHAPVWAPSGQRLAYTSPTIPGVEVYDLDTGKLQQFAIQWGAPPAWSPDGASLVQPELVMAGEEMVVRLVRIDLADEQLVDISGDDDYVKDSSPAWSPGGGWIALGRQYLDDERWTPGRQIWLTRPDASEAYGLPGEPMADHYALSWRPDGAALAYARADLAQGPQAVPDVSVWVFDFEQGESRKASESAVLPRWLP